MDETTIDHLFQGIQYLDIINLEEKINLTQDSLFTINDCFIDLSQIRFVELNAIAKLTLLIETLLKKDSRVFIALPTNKLTNKEAKSTDFDKEIRDNILKTRIKANNFLKTVGFVKAIREISTIYDKEIYLTENYSFETELNLESFQDSFEEIFETKNIDYSSYKYILPLQWIDCEQGLKDFTSIEKRIDKILDDKDRGLEKVDVQGIKNVIFSELIKNVNEHSDSKYALFTIGLISTTSLFKERKGKKENLVEKEYIDWLKKDNIKFQVEIYFGDTGKGILNTDFEEKYKLDNSVYSKKEQLKWAFQKWSTLKNGEPRRGTKGLYRIQRIVNKYNGLFSIITSNHNGGYRKGGLVNPEWIYRKCNYNTEGTFIQIKLCPYIEAKEFKFTLKQNSTKKKWKTINYKPKSITESFESIKRDLETNDNLLLILNLNEFDESKSISFLENKLSELSFEAHPCGLVIYLLSSLKNDTIQIIAESVNEQITRKIGIDIFQELVHKDFEEVYDPVIIIGNDNKVFWYGGNQHLINILNEAYTTSHDLVKISELESYKKLKPEEHQDQVRLHLENDNQLVNINRNGELLFNFSNIDDLFEKIVKKETLSTTKKDIELKYCSPKLEAVENWINYGELLTNNDYGFALTLYLKLRKLQTLSIVEKTESLNSTYLLLDHKQQLRLAKAFATLYGIPIRNIKIITEDINPNIPRRTKLFPEKNKVIVLTTVISSSETVRRLVKYIKRDSAIPIIILTISNNRKYKINKLETWQEKTEIVSVYTKNKTETLKVQRDEEYYDLKYSKINKNLLLKGPNFNTEDEKKFSPQDITLNKELKEYIISKKILHYNHVGIFKNRHFTFYLDKIKLLKSESFLWKKIKTSIDEWKKTNSIDAFTLLLPPSLLPTNYTKSKFYIYLKNITSSIRFIEDNNNYISDTDVVYFDFGIISGKSINNIIIKCAQVEHLFVCILFDQSKNGEFDLYKRISFFNNNNMLVEKQTAFSIEYLYRLPLGFFTSENCPICEHRRALDYYKIKLDYMYSFSEDRQKRLQLKDSSELVQEDYPFDFYYTNKSPDHELSSKLIVKMFEFKMLLDMGRKYTYYRIKLYNYVLDIFKNIHLELSDCNSNLYAVLYYLSHEINWLQKEPLIFKDLRVMLAEISHKISIIKITELVENFQKTNHSKTTPLKLAVRYKYCGISLLRSTDKLKFCESISSIINSSTYDSETLRNNLIQNTFYHTLSLYKNRYNKSNKYYNTISDQLEILSKNNFTPQQESIIEYLEVYNNLFYLGSDLKVIKSLKKDYDKHYTTTNHPYPDNAMANMDLSQFVLLGIEDIKIKEEESEYYTDLKLLTDDLANNWFRVSAYIDINIKLHIEHLSDNFKNSNFFKRIGFDSVIKNIFDNNYLLGITDNLSILVKEINKNPIKYVNRKSEYDNLYNKVYHNLISRDSKFSSFISQFPTDIISIINKKFESKFDKLNIVTSLETIKVFYPQHNLTEAFDFIIGNIKKRKTDDISLSDILININISEINIQNIPYIIMEIEYDSTDNNNNNTPNKTGGLNDVKKEIGNFGGSLIHSLKTDKKGLFHLTFKFLKYE